MPRSSPPAPDRSSRPHRPPGAGPSRRQFLTRAGLLAVGGPALLDACSRGGTAKSTAAALQLASPQHPVTWPIKAGNEPIADSLTPEKNATLQVYNYADYIDPAAIKAFEQKYARYGVKVSVSTFNDIDEALTKIRQGAVPYDVWVGSGYDQTARLVSASLIRPLNHSYIPNIANVWDTFTNPWYDQKWQYTVPYTVYTTGIGWRTDKVPTDIAALPNPYATLWDPRYRGQTAVLDDYRSTIEMCLLKAGITDVNTGRAADLAVAKTQLEELAKATAPKVTVTMYSDLPAGTFGQCAMWSGDVVNAVSYLPKGTSPGILRYWHPKDGKGMIDNDLLLVLRGGKNPVLSHLFLNHMLDLTVAKGNFSFIGYQPPQQALKPDGLVAEGFIPPNLSTVIVRPEDFAAGYPALGLSVTDDAAWHALWLAFKAGS